MRMESYTLVLVKNTECFQCTVTVNNQWYLISRLYIPIKNLHLSNIFKTVSRYTKFLLLQCCEESKNYHMQIFIRMTLLKKHNSFFCSITCYFTLYPSLGIHNFYDYIIFFKFVLLQITSIIYTKGARIAQLV